MEAMKKDHELIVSVSPHVKSDVTTRGIMWTVNLALLPAFIFSIYFFGPRALIVTALCIVTALITEWAFQKMTERDITVSDGSAVLTGLLLGMNLPATAPFYIPIIGTIAAVVITKQLFGGLGYNIFNPALMGRAFVLLTWPRAMTTWMKPDAAFTSFDAISAATPLGILKEEGLARLMVEFGDKANLYTELFLGHRAGSIGETSVLALLIGACYLLYKRYITWHIPLSFIGTVAVMAWAFGGEGWFNGDPLIHVLSGGLILGAFFMATDYVTVPSVRKGQIVFGIGCGLITMLIRLKGGYPEGVMFAILLMNCFTPMIDRNMRSRVFGRQKKAAEEAK